VEKLKRDLRFAKEKADDLERTKASELSSILAKYNREMADLEEALHVQCPSIVPQ
jgi:huntingtin-interacting protein 1-related protein